jgi:hypothetical protein
MQPEIQITKVMAPPPSNAVQTLSIQPGKKPAAEAIQIGGIAKVTASGSQRMIATVSRLDRRVIYILLAMTNVPTP